jgi:hypothetical protein
MHNAPSAVREGTIKWSLIERRPLANAPMLFLAINRLHRDNESRSKAQ